MPEGNIKFNEKENSEDGLAQLVITVIELLRELVERQAMRRVDSGRLTEEEIERLGEALMHLEEQMEMLKDFFGLTDEDLNIDLGPLGNLR
ncbi:gas vesicle protein K [Salsuginibacillus kocurii]|uniref:gas vesicle protein K n=1 Tax=Salsuginibacillus kocurii TaxID=427078 RepID=UPI000476D9FC|nr:gas vesicle protein K [Salsuginibacillus kocurii]